MGDWVSGKQLCRANMVCVVLEREHVETMQKPFCWESMSIAISIVIYFDGYFYNYFDDYSVVLSIVMSMVSSIVISTFFHNQFDRYSDS